MLLFSCHMANVYFILSIAAGLTRTSEAIFELFSKFPTDG